MIAKYFVILQRFSRKVGQGESPEARRLFKERHQVIYKLNSHKMHLSTEEKQQLFETYGQGKTDTGSPESQIALFSVRIKHLTEHLKNNHKDHATERALKMLVGQRRSLLDYLMRKDINRYRAIIAKKELGIRK